MAINEMKPLSITETKDIVENIEDKELVSFLKKFTKLNSKKAEKMRKEIQDLGILKIKDEHIIKIIDLMPEDISDINKIFVDVSLDEDEINKLLEVVKKYS